MKKILFITGTRADYGKIKTLISAVERNDKFEAYIYVSGMHLLEKYGSTYNEVLKDKYINTYVAFDQCESTNMSYSIGNLICGLSGYLARIKPDLVVVHGDRIDALAGAIAGALNNIKVAHIEGGEVSGTIDESIRHSISKLSHIHFVSNEVAKKRLIQMGEAEKMIFVIGSPDLDVMKESNLPPLLETLKKYEIPFAEYGILMYHPVTTEFNQLGYQIHEIVSAVIDSKKNFIVVYPNNDLGSEIIINEYARLKGNSNFKIFPSIRFEYFLSLLKNAKFMIGNSSAGIRETCFYGVQSIDIGSRQHGRYDESRSENIIHCNAEYEELLKILLGEHKKYPVFSDFGDGNSTTKFMEILSDEKIWDFSIQKKFYDLY